MNNSDKNKIFNFVIINNVTHDTAVEQRGVINPSATLKKRPMPSRGTLQVEA